MNRRDEELRERMGLRRMRGVTHRDFIAGDRIIKSLCRALVLTTAIDLSTSTSTENDANMTTQSYFL
jgi:hypothetical protein